MEIKKLISIAHFMGVQPVTGVNIINNVLGLFKLKIPVDSFFVSPIARLLVMRAAWKIENGSKSRQDVSMAKIHVADTLNNVCDTAIQLNGAKGYSKDTILEWIYRYARQAKLVDGASEVHQMIINRFFNNYKSDKI